MVVVPTRLLEVREGVVVGRLLALRGNRERGGGMRDGVTGWEVGRQGVGYTSDGTGLTGLTYGTLLHLAYHLPQP